MLSKKIKDVKIRKLFLKKENLKTKIKFLFVYLLNKKIKKQNFSKLLLYFLKQKHLRNNKTKIVRRCIFTNRSKVSIRTFGISRILLREMFQFGLIPGYTKAVW